MRFGIVVLVLAFASHASAQQVMDASEKQVPEGTMDIVRQGLIASTADPFAAQIIALHPSVRKPGDICGLINLKNRTGGYDGFQPFTVSSGKLFLAEQGGGSCQ